jgi:hypothetical protein
MGGEDFDSHFAYFSDQIAPITRKIRIAEHAGHMHSELLNLACEKIPEIFACVVNFPPEQEKPVVEQLKEFESRVADRLFRLLEAILRLGVTSNAPCYDPDAIAKRIGPILDLVKVVSVAQEQRK